MTSVALFPLTPRAAGRLAARQGEGPSACPYPYPDTMEEGEAAREWVAGWGEGFGIPATMEGRQDMLVARLCELLDALTEIRDVAPPAIRAIAHRALQAGQPEPLPALMQL